jgi:Tfp pilus assembly protein PilF
MSRAEDRLLADREAAYREARELFEELVTLAPRDARIVAGYAEAIALGPAPGAEALADAETLVRAVKAKGTDAGLLWAARADLTLAHGGADAADDARKLAEASLRELTGKDRAFGELALGRTYAASSGKLAVEAFSAALEADPAQRRALVLRGLARESLGDYREARKDLQNRLAMDPDHWRTLDALARIELDGGEVSQAARLFQRAKEAHPSDLRPILALAELHAFADHHPERAVALLETARKEHSSPSPAQKAALEAHLAAAYRLQGMLTLGEKAGAAALEADPQNVTAHLQLALIALARHKPKDALPHLSAIEGKLKAPGLVQLLEGRVRFADGDFAGAAESFGAAVAADPRRMDAALWAGVASAAAGNRQKAEEWGLKVAQADPFHLAPDAEFGPNFVSSAELLDGAEGVYAKLSRGETDVMPDLLEGVVRYFQKDLPGAERSLRTVLASDTGNVIAHAYLALVEAAQKSAQAAVASGAKAVAFGRQFGVAHYAYGEALLAAGQEDAAKRELEQVRLLAPSLLGAEFQLAQLEAKRAPDAARDRLARLLSIDGAYGPARRALYQLDKE